MMAFLVTGVERVWEFHLNWPTWFVVLVGRQELDVQLVGVDADRRWAAGRWRKDLNFKLNSDGQNVGLVYKKKRTLSKAHYRSLKFSFDTR